jgi:hypothetical protein
MTSGAGIVTLATPVVTAPLRKRNSSVAMPRARRTRARAYGDGRVPRAPCASRKPSAASRRPNPSTASMNPADQPRRRNSPSVTERNPSASWSAMTSRMHASWTARKASGASAPARASRAAASRRSGRRKLPTCSARNDLAGVTAPPAGRAHRACGLARTGARAGRASGPCPTRSSAIRRRTHTRAGPCTPPDARGNTSRRARRPGTPEGKRTRT